MTKTFHCWRVGGAGGRSIADFHTRADNGSMATTPEITVLEASRRSVPESREPNLLRFGLRQWFLFVSGIVILTAILAQLDRLAALAAAGLAALIAAHVFGAVVGTRLRDTSGEVTRWRGRVGSPDRDAPVALPQPVAVNTLQLPETTPLATLGAGAWWNRWAIAGGGATGAGMGAAALGASGSADITRLGLLVGAVSCGVIGAWLALLASNFWSIARQAWRHASDRD